MKKILIICIFITTYIRAEISPFAENLQDFSWKFYQKSLSEENLCFSPYSLFLSLGMVYEGASGATAEQMQEILHFTPSIMEVSPVLQISNALWVQEGLSLLPSYQTALSEHWNANVDTLDFFNPTQAARTINSWVKKNTHNMIDRILSPADLSEDIRLVLTNTLYFHDEWKTPFRASLTQKAPFFTGEESYPLVDMMERSGSFAYLENGYSQFLMIPFRNSSYACFFLLPKTSLQDLEEHIDEISLKELTQNAVPMQVLVQIPRIDLKYTCNANEAFHNMGITLPFSQDADLSKMSEEVRLKMNKVLHKTRFTLNETGVTAAAATGITMGTTSIQIEPEPSEVFIADHPFLFGIVNLHSNVILFLGKLTHPQ